MKKYRYTHFELNPRVLDCFWRSHVHVEEPVGTTILTATPLLKAHPLDAQLYWRKEYCCHGLYSRNTAYRYMCLSLPFPSKGEMMPVYTLKIYGQVWVRAYICIYTILSRKYYAKSLYLRFKLVGSKSYQSEKNNRLIDIMKWIISEVPKTFVRLLFRFREKKSHINQTICAVFSPKVIPTAVYNQVRRKYIV